MKIDLEGFKKIDVELDRLNKLLDDGDDKKEDMRLSYIQGLLFAKRAVLEE